MITMNSLAKKIYNLLPLYWQYQVKHLFQRSIHRSRYTNVFHCTNSRAGGSWISGILADKRTYYYSGLISFSYDLSLPGQHDPRLITDKIIVRPFPPGTVATPLHIDYKGYRRIPKRGRTRAVFVLRDPRDLVVSEYFSMRYSHKLMGEVSRIRHALELLSQEDGIMYILEYLHIYGTYESQRSWIEEGARDSDVMIIHFSDIIRTEDLSAWKKMFDHFDVRMPEPVLSGMLEDHSFERMAGGRKTGEEDQRAHYRKGKPGDWRNYFSDKIKKRFKLMTGDLLVKLGYEKNDAW